MDGGPGADTLYGGQGDDRLTGGAGADELRGGAGQDWVSYEGSDIAVTVKLSESIVEGGHAQGDIVVDIENVIGSDYPDILGGDNHANHLYGGAGDDGLWGGNGDERPRSRSTEAPVLIGYLGEQVSTCCHTRVLMKGSR